ARFEDEQARAVEQSRLLLGSLPIACLVLDSEFRVTYLNEAAEQLFGYELSELLGREPFGYITAPEYTDFVRQLFQMLARGELSGPSFGENVNKQGKRFLSEWTN